MVCKPKPFSCEHPLVTVKIIFLRILNLISLTNDILCPGVPAKPAETIPLPGLGTYELEPVFYAPDGQELTMEEYDFMQEYGMNDEDNFG